MYIIKIESENGVFGIDIATNGYNFYVIKTDKAIEPMYAPMEEREELESFISEYM